MATLQETRKRFSALLMALLVLALLAAGYLLSPWSSPVARADEIRQLEERRQQLTREVAPLQGMDDKLEGAREQINSFFEERLAPSAVTAAERLGAIARQNGVVLSAVRYQTEEAELAGVLRIAMTATVAGNYRNVAAFINEIERDDIFFIIESVALAGASEGEVRLTMNVQSFRRI